MSRPSTRAQPTIGGRHGRDGADYARRAQAHRPDDPTAEIRRLRDGGLKPIDISVALKIALPAVFTALRSPDRRNP